MLQVSVESKLRARVDFLEEENRQLRERIAAPGNDCQTRTRLAFGLTESEAIALGILLRCGMATYSLLEDELYLDRSDELPGDMRGAIRTHMKRLRRRLRPHGITIGTVYSAGFLMDEPMRAKVRKTLDGVPA